MAGLNHGTMTIEFSPQARRLLERTTKALEEMAKEQKRGRIEVHNHPEPAAEAHMRNGANTAAEDLDLENKDWRTAVGETMGYISMCWSTPEGAGTFGSTRAGDAVEVLITRLEREMP